MAALYENGDLQITASALKFKGVTYPISAITSFAKTRIASRDASMAAGNKWAGIFGVGILGLVLAVFSLILSSGLSLLVLVVTMALTTYLISIEPEKATWQHAVIIITASGPIQVPAAGQTQAEQIIEALDESIRER